MDTDQRQCKTCKLTKPLIEEFWIKRKSIFRHVCRDCENASALKYYFENREKRIKQMQEWKLNNKSKLQEYRKKNRDYFKNYKKLNSEKYKEYYKNRERKKRLNLTYRLHQRMSRSISHHLKSNNLNKNYNCWLKYVDYTVLDLKKHLESKFLEGMNWDNYGKWHIDHIKPKSLFKITNLESEDFKKCWSLDNLQPLWAFDNISKGNRRIG